MSDAMRDERQGLKAARLESQVEDVPDEVMEALRGFGESISAFGKKAALPIPAKVWSRMLAFLVAGKTGRIELYVHDGRIRKCEIVDSFRIDDVT